MEDDFLGKQRAFWNTMASTIKDDVAANHWLDRSNKPLNRKLFREIAMFVEKKFLKDKIDGDVLEIGCGNGLVLKELSEILGNKWRLHGCDISEKMISRAGVYIGRENVTLYCADAGHIPYKDQKFDLVYFHGVVQYFDNETYLLNVILESIRKLKPGGGLCFLDVPFIWYRDLMVQKPKEPKKIRKIICFVERNSNTLRKLLEVWRKGRKLLEVRRKGREPRSEDDDVSQVPVTFRGFWPNPESFYAFQDQFEHVSIEIQPFQYKPINYRMFRFNVLMKSKRFLGDSE